MKTVQIENVTKYYGALRALNKISVTIERGELFFLLGPSGCGKTTLLRAIAGFVQPESGSIKIGGVESIRIRPQHRQTAMVFQSYALWPHMTVFDNVAFGLKLQKLPREEIRTRTKAALAMVRMDGQEAKKPNMLSGGMQQRVALARALVVRPACLLLDEPLSNLDAKLREEMRHEIRRICKENGLTGIYVTHDQKEALAIADRIAVMDKGKIVQVGSPDELYRQPLNRFVADFIGQSNLISATIKDINESAMTLDTPFGQLKIDASRSPVNEIGGRVAMVVRPEAISTRPFFQETLPFKARVDESTFLGELVLQKVVLPDETTSLTALGISSEFMNHEKNALYEWWIDFRYVAFIPDES